MCLYIECLNAKCAFQHKWLGSTLHALTSLGSRAGLMMFLAIKCMPSYGLARAFKLCMTFFVPELELYLPSSGDTSPLNFLLSVCSWGSSLILLLSGLALRASLMSQYYLFIVVSLIGFEYSLLSRSALLPLHH